MARSPRPPPPPWIGLGPPVAGALLLAFRNAAWFTWLVLGGAVLVVAILELVCLVTASNGEKRPELRPMAQAGVALARLVSVAVASMESMVAVAIGLNQVQAVPLILAAGLLMLLISVVTGVRRISAALAAIRAAGHGAMVKGYGPMFYADKDNPKIWVPKISSIGHTLNFAHPVSWLILAALLVVPIGGAALALVRVLSVLRF